MGITLETVYFIGQTVAAFAIVGSLIFVGLQSRQAVKASELAAYQAVQDRLNVFRKMVVADKELTSLYDRGLRDPAQLDDEELVRFRLMMFIAIEAAQESFLLAQRSPSQIAQWNYYERFFLQFVATPGGRTWWALMRHALNQQFAGQFGSLIDQSPIKQTITKQDWIDALNALATERDGAK